MSTIGYPIRAAAKLSGLPADTLRAWERRYRAVVPSRAGRGRLYSDAQVARLRWLRDAVNAGHSISQIASLSDREVRKLVGRIQAQAEALAAVPKPVAPTASRYEQAFNRVIDAIELYDYVEAESELSRLAAMLSPRELVLDVLLPLVRRVGNEWHRGRLHIAQEHMFSAILRSLLGTLTRMYASQTPTLRVLMTTPTGDMHEFGILAAALLAVGHGVGVIYLGPDLPATEILRAAEKTRANVVLLGMTRQKGNLRGVREAARVASKLPRQQKLWIGGTAHCGLRRAVNAGRATIFETFEAIDTSLRELDATAPS
jgi:MerR family transcriptional regulator, light-induced transcriptional regulator